MTSDSDTSSSDSEGEEEDDSPPSLLPSGGSKKTNDAVEKRSADTVDTPTKVGVSEGRGESINTDAAVEASTKAGGLADIGKSAITVDTPTEVGESEGMKQSIDTVGTPAKADEAYPATEGATPTVTPEMKIIIREKLATAAEERFKRSPGVSDETKLAKRIRFADGPKQCKPIEGVYCGYRTCNVCGGDPYFQESSKVCSYFQPCGYESCDFCTTENMTGEQLGALSGLGKIPICVPVLGTERCGYRTCRMCRGAPHYVESPLVCSQYDRCGYGTCAFCRSVPVNEQPWYEAELESNEDSGN
jgi:hypothetical protein